MPSGRSQEVTKARPLALDLDSGDEESVEVELTGEDSWQCGRIRLDDVTGDKVIKQAADGRQVLLDGGLASLTFQQFAVSRHVGWLNVGEREAVSITPGREGEYGSQIGRPGIRVINLGGEELDEASRVFSPGRRDQVRSRVSQGCF